MQFFKNHIKNTKVCWVLWVLLVKPQAEGNRREKLRSLGSFHWSKTEKLCLVFDVCSFCVIVPPFSHRERVTRTFNHLHIHSPCFLKYQIFYHHYLALKSSPNLQIIFQAMQTFHFSIFQLSIACIVICPAFDCGGRCY